MTAEDLGYKQIEADTTLKGDANCDGKVDILDVIKVNKYILGTASLDPAGQQNADMNSNEKIDTDDVLAILKATLDIAG